MATVVRRTWLLLTLMGCALTGCGTEASNQWADSSEVAHRPASPGTIRFRDAADEAGLRFAWGHQGKSPLTILESLGQGAAFADYDGDGLLDILLVSDRSTALFHNAGSGRFEEVTEAMVAGVRGYWHGIASGDYDNDGDADFCLVGYRSLALLRNDRIRFTNVSAGSGLQTPAWGSSAGFADLDADGWLDLVVGEYLEFGPDSVQHCTVGEIKTACGPKIYPPRFPRVYRNRKGYFENATREWGFDKAAGKTLGIAFGDFNDDRRLDVALANDEMPQDLFLRQPGSTVRFRNDGVERGFAFLHSGKVQSGMGIDAGDGDGDGDEDLVITNFQNEPAGFYVNDGDLFTEGSASAGISEPTFPYVGWGVRFFDADNDGDLDLLMANGHIQDNVHLTSAATTYPQPLLLMVNEGRGRFTRCGESVGPLFGSRMVGRGLALGDYDNDGKVDALVVDIEGKPLLLHNETPNENHWIGLELVTGSPARPALGARATITAANTPRSRRATTCGSIFSAHDPRVQFGLGAAEPGAEVLVDWEDGVRERFPLAGADQYQRIKRGHGKRVR